MTAEKARIKAHKAWNVYRKEPDKKRKREFLAEFKVARAEYLLVKESEKK